MMVTIGSDYNKRHEYYGLSTDTKPANAPNSSTFYEMDTQDLYMYNAASGQWVKQ